MTADSIVTRPNCRIGTMTKQTVQMMDDYFPPQQEAIQTQRCWVLLNAIFGKKIAIQPPAAIKAPTNLTK
jgi:hypothetical protein